MSKKTRKSIELLPEFLRTEKNSKFLSSTIDQLIEPPQLERINGFIGSKLTPVYNPETDNYISESTPFRKSYQLEPALVVNNTSGDSKAVVGVDDLINTIISNGGFGNNFDRLFRSNEYSFDPCIDWDKFVNYQNYFWMVTGPDLVTIYGNNAAAVSSYSVVDNQNNTSWRFSSKMGNDDPVITLYRGGVYTFEVNSTHKFFIKTTPDIGTDNLYVQGVGGNGSSNGSVTLVVDNDTPNILFYGNDVDVNFVGQIVIKNQSENSKIDVEADIIGKRDYQSQGVALSNGMKITFGGEVTPSYYKDKQFFVEGVGNSISLVDYDLLTVSEKLSPIYSDKFDAQPFDAYPFDNFKNLPVIPEYITINRASLDLNPWSRYNRWVHKSVIEKSASFNGKIPEFIARNRAKRPIIEFDANLKLYNFGTKGLQSVDLIDSTTTDVFSLVEGSAGYYIDGILVEQGHRIIFNADTDPDVREKIFTATFITVDGDEKLQFVASDDYLEYGSSVTVELGNSLSGTSWWYNGSNWVFAQQHKNLNQSPLFDLFDNNEISYSDSIYGNLFAGNKLFGYDEGSIYDPVLGFYIKNRSNAVAGVGSWLFRNYLTDDISIIQDSAIAKIPATRALLKINSSVPFYKNVWADKVEHRIPVLQFQTINSLTNLIEITSVSATSQFDDIELYVNGSKVSQSKYRVDFELGKLYVICLFELNPHDTVLLKLYTTSPVINDGWSETPISLTNNPLNAAIESVSLTEMQDHLDTMINDPAFNRQTINYSNLNDNPQITKYGSRLVSNESPIAFANFFIGLKEHSLLNAIDKSSEQYNQFKLAFLKTISAMPSDTDTVAAVDFALLEINKDKEYTGLWASSDMVAYGNDKISRSWIFKSDQQPTYPISTDFNLDNLSNRSVLIYKNDSQLVSNKDYKFNQDSGVDILVALTPGDKITIVEYSSTNNCYVPSTPSKLGLYPLYRPEIYTDKSFANGETNVILGHDGSITLAYNDYRDNIILELELRIFNNVKSKYNADLIDVFGVFTGAFRQFPYPYSNDEINSILYRDFNKWSGFYGIEYENNDIFDQDNSLTWNLTGAFNSTADSQVFGSWRAVFKYLYDTDRPDVAPWEMLGFTIQPEWWEDTYGPAPYTSGNTILWGDLEQGLIRHGDRAGSYPTYVRPGLSEIIPVTDSGNLVDITTLLSGITQFGIRQPWKFGDFGAGEMAWRRSSYWPFAVQKMLALTIPAKYAALMYDLSRLKTNLSGQLVYGDNNEFLSLTNVVVPGVDGALTSGYSVYISEIGKQKSATYIESLDADLKSASFNLFYKVGGFISKDKVQISIDAVSPTSSSPGALLPTENYKVILNVSNPVKTTSISGVIVQRDTDGFIVKGYDRNTPCFNIFKPIRNSITPAITVGGVSEPYVIWAASATEGSRGLSPTETATATPPLGAKFYQVGQIVQYGGEYYRTAVSHSSGNTFDSTLFRKLKSLPVVGGATAQIPASYSTSITSIPYGSKFNSIQDVYDIILGYGKWLETEGFIFDYYSSDLNSVVNWDLSSREFLYWTTQNWAKDSVITVSPFAAQIKYHLPNTVVDNIFDSFYEYAVKNASGLPIPQSKISVYRDDGVCVINPTNTEDGIYFATLNSVQKEHAIIFDNITAFNDVVYSPETGYKQHRMLVSGFRTAMWDGDYFSPGFVYDAASIKRWKPYIDYKYSDLVKYQGKYYSAIQNISGSKSFEYTKWVLLGSTPVAGLIPNFEYKINQFEDFYSLDIDNFDVAQQDAARHLIGYTPRVFLNNIFINPIAQYKFYQGYIKEKGTKNSISKLAKSSIYNLQGEIDFTEEWAFRAGYFGGFTTYKEIEFPVEEGTFIENPQVIEFVDTVPVDNNNLIKYITPESLSIRPEDYVSDSVFSQATTDVFKLGVAGYANLNDVTHQILSIEQLLSFDKVSELTEGNVFWIGFTTNQDWNLLRYERAGTNILEITPGERLGEIVIKTDSFHGFSKGDFVSVTNVNSTVDKIYQVDSIVSFDTFVVFNNSDALDLTDISSGAFLFKFSKARYSNFDELPPDSHLLSLPIGTKFWVDDADNNGNWAVYEKIKNYTDDPIYTPTNPPNQRFGSSVVRSKDTNLLVVGAPGFINSNGVGRVFVYQEDSNLVSRKFNYVLNSLQALQYDDGGNSEFGYSVGLSDTVFNDTDFGLIFIGAPKLSGGKGELVNGVNYSNPLLPSGQLIEQGGVKISSINSVLFGEKSEIVLLSPSPRSYQRFGHSIAVNTATTRLVVGAPGTGTGYTYVFDLDLQRAPIVLSAIDDIGELNSNEELLNLNSGAEFGNSVAASSNGYIAVGAPGFSIPGHTEQGMVAIFSGTTAIQQITLPEELNSDFSRFGEQVILSDTGSQLFVSAPGHRNENQSIGIVLIYSKLDTGMYDLDNPQILTNPVSGQGMRFGTAISYENSLSQLVVSSVGTNKSVYLTFDGLSTTVDSDATKFFDVVEDFGTVYTYSNKITGNRYVITEELKSTINSDRRIDGSRFGQSVFIDRNAVYVGAPGSSTNNESAIHRYFKTDTTRDGIDKIRFNSNLVDLDILEKVSLYDSKTESVIEYLEVIDPAKGKISGLADQELRYKSSYDPATYSVGISSTNNDLDTNWLDNHEGELWWDLSQVKYVWYEQSELLYRKNNWGKLFEGCSIDIYEWVGSEYLPSQWAELADTTEGLSKGISGQPKFLDDSVYSVKQVYDYASNSFTNRYFFWVKNKVTVPNVTNRRISAMQVSNIILDPTGYGLKYAALLSKNSIIVANVNNLLVGDNVSIHLSYDNDKNTVPRHTEWVLMQEGNPNSVPNTLLEKKLFDSLIGHDSLGNLVPDPSLSDRIKYGIEVRPRQSMFKKRSAALRELVEYTNSVLAKNLITGNADFTNLLKAESYPDQYSKAYDLIVEDLEELALVDTTAVRPAILTCEVYNGKLTLVTINDSGFGYKDAPLLTVDGSGIGAEISATIDNTGRVVSCEIKNSGTGYQSVPAILVRPFTVVVQSDATYDGKWSLFTWNSVTNNWSRTRTQQYNTPMYWDYIDWQSDKFNQFLDYTATVDSVYELETLSDILPSSYVKVKNGGAGRYLVLEKTDNSVGTFSNDYDIVYSEKGTIKLSDSIWDVSARNSGFDDSDSSFDGTLYDQTIDIELQYILYAIKRDLFVNDLKVCWNLLFFKLVRYTLTEQRSIDWAFKTSFINVINYGGTLDQRPIYKIPDSRYYEEYIKEVKPYHTQIRSYTTNNTILEPTKTYTTDFDLPSRFNFVNGKFEVSEDMLQEYPWKSWDDNKLFEVDTISVNYPGEGYLYQPEVLIEAAPGDLGRGAKAVAYISSGKVVAVEVTNPGKDYAKSPVVTLIGGGATTPAVVYAQVSNKKVRSNLINIKFDRISKTTSIGNLSVVDEYVCNGSANEFLLTWLANPNKSKIGVYLSGVSVSPSDYRVVEYTSVVNGYNNRFTKIVLLNEVPANGKELKVEYTKHVELFHAVDRIDSLYTPTANMPGTTAQLMYGTEYPGTIIQGIPFSYSNKWDIQFDSGEYNKFDELPWAEGIGIFGTAEVQSVQVGSTSTTLTISYPNNGDLILPGCFVNFVSTLTNSFSDDIVTVISTNEAGTVIEVDSRFIGIISTTNTNVIEYWNYDNSQVGLDSVITGGDLQRLYAVGVNPEDIVIDGDKFISENSSYAPEEVVPGFVTDTIGINVYTRNIKEAAPTVVNGIVEISTGSQLTTVELLAYPPNKESISVYFNGKLLSYTTATLTSVDIDAPYFGINWESNSIVIGPQTTTGKLGYTIITIGSNSPTEEIGVVDSDHVTTYGTTTVKVVSLSDDVTIKGAYVSVNGETIGSQETTGIYYQLVAESTSSARAAVELFNIPELTTSTVQAWFFGNEVKYFNEIREEYITYSSTTNTYTLSYPPGNIEPAAANATVEVVLNDGSRKKLLPPVVTYYKVTDPLQREYSVVNNRIVFDDFVANRMVRVFLNGLELLEGELWVKPYDSEYVNISASLESGDVIAILTIGLYEPMPDFDIVGNSITFLTNSNGAITDGTKIRVVTYNNHDGMLLRTERFDGNSNRRFTVSREITNDEYVWVDLDGVPLISRYDFEILDDSKTIQISDRFVINSDNTVVITTVGTDSIASDVLGYRIFNDIFGKTHFKRLAKDYTTELAQPLYSTSTEIHVKDSSVLSHPIPSKGIPGVVLVNRERIEFYSVDGNTLKKIKRATLGTGASALSPIGTTVIDQSLWNDVPYNETIYTNITFTNNTTSTYTIGTGTEFVSVPYSTSTVKSDGITLRTTPVSNPDVSINGNLLPINADDQLIVSYGGRILRKDRFFYHDTTISYFTPEYTIVGSVETASLLPATDIVGDAFIVEDTKTVWVYSASLEKGSVNGYTFKGVRYLEEEFVINTSTNEITLNLQNGIKDGVELRITKKDFERRSVWNDEIDDRNTKSLMESTTPQARFLQARLSELPDKRYYGR